MSNEDEVAKAELLAAKVEDELLAAEDAAKMASKEPSKRQKQKQKRKNRDQKHKLADDETSVPSLVISWAEQEEMLAESTALAAHYADFDRQAALTGVSQEVNDSSEVEFVDDEEEGQTGAADPGPKLAAMAPVCDPIAPAGAEPRHSAIAAADGDRATPMAAALHAAAALLSSGDEARRQAVQMVLLWQIHNNMWQIHNMRDIIASSITKRILRVTRDALAAAPPRDRRPGCARAAESSVARK